MLDSICIDTWLKLNVIFIVLVVNCLKKCMGSCYESRECAEWFV